MIYNHSAIDCSLQSTIAFCRFVTSAKVKAGRNAGGVEDGARFDVAHAKERVEINEAIRTCVSHATVSANIGKRLIGIRANIGHN